MRLSTPCTSNWALVLESEVALASYLLLNYFSLTVPIWGNEQRSSSLAYSHLKKRSLVTGSDKTHRWWSSKGNSNLPGLSVHVPPLHATSCKATCSVFFSMLWWINSLLWWTVSSIIVFSVFLQFTQISQFTQNLTYETLPISHLPYLTKCFLIVSINPSISHAIQFILYFLFCNSIRFRKSYKKGLSHPIFWKPTDYMENGIGVHSRRCFLNALHVSANAILKQM